MVANLAVLLEYNRLGFCYRARGQLKDALDEYHKPTAEKLAELGPQNNHPFALFYDGQFSRPGKLPRFSIRSPWH